MDERAEALRRFDAELAARRQKLEDQITEARGEVTERDRALLDSWSAVERTRLEAEWSLTTVGLRETYRNGRQRVERENKSFLQMMRASTVAARLLAQLLPIRPGKGVKEVDADADGTDDLDNY